MKTQEDYRATEKLWLSQTRIIDYSTSVAWSGNRGIE